MSILNTIKEIAEILLLLTVSVLVISAVIYLKRIVNSIEDIKIEVVKISQNLNTTVTELNASIRNVNYITDNARTEIIRIRNLTDIIIIKFNDLSRKAEDVYRKGEDIFNNGKRFISAILRGVKVFKQRLAA